MTKVIIGMSIISTTTFIILFVELGILLTSFPQFVYAQTAENEIIENALESVEKASTEGISKITESLHNNSKATDSTNTSDRFILQSQSEFKDSTRNWINGESDKLNFRYPSNWEVNVSDSRFDNYEVIFRDKGSDSSIRISDEAISTTNKIFLTANNSQGYFDIYMMQNSPLSSNAQKIETYSKGKVLIAGLPAYSDLYLDKEYAILISLAFQKENERHYTVLSASPLSHYDKLEPTILEIIETITPKTMQKPSTGEVEISSNNSDSVDLSNNQDAKQLKKEDHVERESLLSNLTESNNYTSNESIIKQENGSLTQKSNIYEGLGLKMKYFDPLKIGMEIYDSTMFSSPDFEAGVMILQDKFDDPKIKYKCKCDTLLEFVKYVYEDTISVNEDLVFINDNQTTLTDGNISAIQMEYENKADTMIGQNLIYIFTKIPNSFYTILFSADKNEQYPKYLDDFKKMLNSLEFVSTNETKPKQPSFMTSEEEVNESTSPSISNNQKEEDFSELIKTLDKSFDKLSGSKELTILSHDSYINSAGNMHIIGEVENNTPDIAEYVKVIGTLYDNNDKMVGTSFTFTSPSDLAPDEKAPFDLIIQDTTVPIEQIERYTLKISFR